VDVLPLSDGSDHGHGGHRCPDPIEHKREGLGVSGAHRDLEELLRSCGEVEMSAGHGEALTAALRPGLEKNRSVGSTRG